MPYYCTVPKCTSMAGKAKNVSFHQFPRDVALARRWNLILKRGKPYTKYSKVCSLHFKPEDYTITTVGKNKGQWRTLRKDATPSQNLPTDSTSAYQICSTSRSYSPTQSGVPHLDPQTQQTLAQAIYMHTMLAMQAADLNKRDSFVDNDTAAGDYSPMPDNMVKSEPAPESPNMSAEEGSLEKIDEPKENIATDVANTEAKIDCDNLKCNECSKCFKDPDVFILHKRSHVRHRSDQEHLYRNHERNESQLNTLKANPILTNLLNSRKNYADIDILSMENKIMAAMAFNMNAYVSNLASLVPSGNGFAENVKTESGFPENGSLLNSGGSRENAQIGNTYPCSPNEADTEDVKMESGFPEKGSLLDSGSRENAQIGNAFPCSPVEEIVKMENEFPENGRLSDSGSRENAQVENTFPYLPDTERGIPENDYPGIPENVKMEKDFPENVEQEMDFLESGNSDVSDNDDRDNEDSQNILIRDY